MSGRISPSGKISPVSVPRSRLAGCEKKTMIRTVCEQIVQIGASEGAEIVSFSQNAIRKNRFEDLAVINLLFDRPACDQAVDGDRTLLPDSPTSLARLNIDGWVPIRIKKNDSIGPNEIDSESSHSRSQQKQKDGRIGIEEIDESLAFHDRRAAVHHTIRKVLLLDVFHDDGEHGDGLRVYQHFVSLLLPNMKHFVHYDHLGGFSPIHCIEIDVHLRIPGFVIEHFMRGRRKATRIVFGRFFLIEHSVGVAQIYRAIDWIGDGGFCVKQAKEHGVVADLPQSNDGFERHGATDQRSLNQIAFEVFEIAFFLFRREETRQYLLCFGRQFLLYILVIINNVEIYLFESA